VYLGGNASSRVTNPASTERGDQINARVKPALELADGTLLRFGSRRSAAS